MFKNKAALKKLKQDLAEIRNEIQNPPAPAVKDRTPAGIDMEDGSVLVATGVNGKQIFALPVDLGFAANFNNTVKAVKKLNERKALGHDDWQIPDFHTMKILQQNQNQGSLKGTFNPKKSNWYWSSSQDEEDPFGAWAIGLSDGRSGWGRKSKAHLSCRHVRIVAAEAPPAP